MEAEELDKFCNERELLIAKQQQLRLLRQKAEMIKSDGLPFYRPHPKQDLFHRSTARRRGCFTGNRFGKSTMGCAEDCAWLRHERPWYPQGDPARTSGLPQYPVKGLIIANDWDKVKEIWTGEDGKLWKFLPADGFVTRATSNHSGAIDTLICANGSSLRFDTVKSYMSNPLGTESSDWDFIHVDEPCPEKMFKAASRGLVDRNGSAWFTLTALREAWITDAFLSDGMFAFDAFSIEGAIFDNPYLTTDAINAYAATLSAEEKECRLEGKPFHKIGLIYKEFHRETHVLKNPPSGWADWLTPPPSWPVYTAIDYHPQTPHAVLFCAIDPYGRRYYYNEIYEHTNTTHLAELVLAARQGRYCPWTKLDPYAFINDPITDTNAATELEDHGVTVEKATKALAQGILKVQGELKKLNAINFTPLVRRTLWEIERYMWAEGENKPIDKDDHMMENLYRLELSGMRFVEPSPSLDIPELEIVGPDFHLDRRDFSLTAAI